MAVSPSDRTVTGLSSWRLRLAAALLRTSVRKLVKAVFIRELGSEAGSDPQLQGILQKQRPYTREEIEADIAQFARAEATEEDPLRSQRVFPEDAHGVSAAFGASFGDRVG